MNNNFSMLKNLTLLREGERNRISSYDRSGGNSDFITVQPGELAKIARIKGTGCINHIWMTLGEFPILEKKNYLRKVVIRMYRDGEENSRGEVPIGDFFGMRHAQTKIFNSMPLAMSPEGGKSFNCFFAMPFSSSADIEILNEYENPIKLYFYIDLIFIDGDIWPPRLHGTGTKDCFNTAWSPIQEVNNPYYGIILAGEKNWAGKILLYRYHIGDSVIFNKSIRVTIEHGHNNHKSDDYNSTAYWYQAELHKKHEPLLPADERLPLPDNKPLDFEEMKKHLDL